ncbi:hypothetical protein ACO0RG_002746 [Hanseniaspora osmophila]
MVRRSARLIKQGGELQAKDAETTETKSVEPAQAVDETNSASSLNASQNVGHQEEISNESRNAGDSATVTEEKTISPLSTDQAKSDSPKPQRQKRKYVRQKRLSTANDETLDAVNGSLKKNVTKLPKSLPKHPKSQKAPAPRKMMKEPVIKPRIGKMTTTIHKTADQRKIIRVFKRKSLFPEVKQFKEKKVFKKPRHTDFTMEEQYMHDESIDERKYEDIIKDIESLTNIKKDSCIMQCMKTLREVVVPCENQRHKLLSNNKYDQATIKDKLKPSQLSDGMDINANDFMFHEDSPKLKNYDKEQDQGLYELLTKDENTLNEEHIVTTIARLNNIDISHINTLLTNRNIPRAPNSNTEIAKRASYTNDEIRRDHEAISQKMNVKRKKK